MVRRFATAADWGACVRQVRRARGWDQAQLARVCGVSRMTISRLERGEDVSVVTAIRALSECGYSVTVAQKRARVVVEDFHG